MQREETLGKEEGVYLICGAVEVVREARAGRFDFFFYTVLDMGLSKEGIEKGGEKKPRARKERKRVY